MKRNWLMQCALACGALIAAPMAHAAMFSEGFDSDAADVKIVKQGNAIATFVDYSNFTVGATSHSIPEAPRKVGGSADTKGLLLQANVATGAAEAINVLAGASPVVFSGEYKMSFDAWIGVADPVPAGGTEQLIWGVGSADDGDFEARNTRTTADGVWGWLSGENGYGSEDATIYVNGTAASAIGDTQTDATAALFNSAFTTNFGANNAAANSWVRVDVFVRADSTSVKFNGVEFFSIPAAAPAGAALLGYEDPFGGSLSAAPDFQWGLFDNFTVGAIPEPASASLLALGLVGVATARRRR